jgi:hypothetical protein
MQLNALSPIPKSFSNLELECTGTYGETFFCNIYMIYFSDKYVTENPTFQEYTSPFHFSIANENKK